MISKVEMVKELADVEVELALRSMHNSGEVVKKIRERYLQDISKGTSRSNPEVKISSVIYEIILLLGIEE